MDKPTKFLLHTKIPNDFASSRSLKENVHNSCLVHIFFMDKLGGFLIYSKTGYDMRLCLNFDPRSLYKFKDTDRKKSHNSCLVHMCLRDKHCEFPFNTKIAYDLRLCHVFELRSFMQVQGHWQKKFVSGLYTFFINLHLRFIHKNYNEQLYLHKKCFCISSLKSMEHSWFGTSEKSSGG